MEQDLALQAEADYGQQQAELSFVGRIMNRLGAYKEAAHDEQIRAAAGAVGRTVVNAAITAIDFVPVFGEAASWGADAGRLSARLGMVSQKFDLTPDVGMVVSGLGIASEGAEPFVAGFASTHWIESSFQLRHDVKRMRAGRQRWQEIKAVRRGR